MGKWEGGSSSGLNDNPSLTSLEKTNGAPRWCFNIPNYLDVRGKGTDVALRMRRGWGVGQGHHTPRLGSDKHGWLRVFTCPPAEKRGGAVGRVESKGWSVIPRRARGASESWGTEVQRRHMPGLGSSPALIGCFGLFLREHLLNY